MSALVRRRVTVRGRVQGVWFRESTKARAGELGLAGWVRNVPDGSVEAVFEGPPDAVAAVVAWCADGPPAAEVTEIEARAEPAEGLSGFAVRR